MSIATPSSPSAAEIEQYQQELIWRLPDQGSWSEAEYLAILAERFVEFTDGRVEPLPTPTLIHQTIVEFFYILLLNLKLADGRATGRATVAPFILNVRRSKLRLPDVLFMKRENFHRVANDRWDYADLVMEVVSPGGENRDYIEKRQAYAEAKIPEYWIVDPQSRKVTILVLDNDVYTEHTFTDTDRAVSPTVPGLEIGVAELIDRPIVPA